MKKVYIGIDLAWSAHNKSGICVLEYVGYGSNVKILEVSLITSLEDILTLISKYDKHYEVFVGVDAPLQVDNIEGNRQIEKDFNKDFAKYKIAMLPVNRTLLLRMCGEVRGESLKKELDSLGISAFEVYPHAIIARCFNKNKILPYKRKKGRSVDFIREQLQIYKNYLQGRFEDKHTLFSQDISALKGRALKAYEDQLDAISCAYGLYLCLEKKYPYKIYMLEDKELFITPI